MFMVITYKYPPLQVLEFHTQIEKPFMHHKKINLYNGYILNNGVFIEIE